jgi:2-polyprenyl-3-methyl-5-hydroxy-6-metoxy-1,4-benzoquinol methylase
VGLGRGAVAGVVVSAGDGNAASAAAGRRAGDVHGQPRSATAPICRFCGQPLSDVFADLGSSPLANSYLPPERLAAMEPFYPLCALVCANCFLVQLQQFESPAQIFSDYAYFSSYSKSWLEHSERYVAQIVALLGLGAHSQVTEIASNDGYLLQYFRRLGVPVRGVEPAANVAAVAAERGIPTVVRFFGRDTAALLAQQARADLIVANNVLAHVPDINDFLAGVALLLAPGGVVTMEFPHLLRLMHEKQWDTIYHEHFSYLSLLTATRLFAAHGLRLFDVEELSTHGGSLRVYGAHSDNTARPESERARALLERERAAGLQRIETYTAYAAQVAADKRQILGFLIELKQRGLRIAGYGAPAKGNTLLNYTGVRGDFLDYTVDASPHKQGRYLPGSRLPIRAPAALREDRPDVVLILPWNLRAEIVREHAYIREWGARFAARTQEGDAAVMGLLP